MGPLLAVAIHASVLLDRAASRLGLAELTKQGFDIQPERIYSTHGDIPATREHLAKLAGS